MISNLELEKILNAKVEKTEIIRKKDGIVVSRIFYDKKTCVIKYFKNKEYLREIEAYKLLYDLKIKTLKILYFGENFLIMEDLNNVKEYRLATYEDLEDDKVLKNLAKWYKNLHQKGISCDFSKMYNENDIITEENLKMLSSRLGEENVEFLLSYFDDFVKFKNSLSYTLVYNDFAFENLIVGKNVAFMYDFNFLGKGYVYADVKNVLSMLSKEKKSVFLDFYGQAIFLEKEEIAYNVLQTLSAFIKASLMSKFPRWAEGMAERIKSESFKNYVKNIKQYI